MFLPFALPLSDRPFIREQLVLQPPDPSRKREIFDRQMSNFTKTNMAATSEQQNMPSEDQPTETIQQVDATQDVQDVDKEDEQVSNGKVQALRSSKKAAKARLTRARKSLNDLIEKQFPGVNLPSKNAIRRAINKVNSEFHIIEKIIDNLKEIYAVSTENDNANTIIDTLDKELEDIGSLVDSVIVMAENHLAERLQNGEADSVITSHHLQTSSPVKSNELQVIEEKKQREAKEASERLTQMENEEKEKEQELQRLTAELHLTKQRTNRGSKKNCSHQPLQSRRSQTKVTTI